MIFCISINMLELFLNLGKRLHSASGNHGKLGFDYRQQTTNTELPASIIFMFFFCFVLLSQTFINQSYFTQPLPNTDATISLPVSCSHYLKPGQRNETRIQFNYFGTLELFQVRFHFHHVPTFNFPQAKQPI